MDFIVDNYIWFIIGALIILMTVVGYIAEKTDFASKKRDKRKNENMDENQVMSNDNVVPEVSIPVQDTLDNNLYNQNLEAENNVNIDNQLSNDNLNSEVTIDGVPSELFAPLNPSDTISIDNVSPNVDLNESVEPVTLSEENNNAVSDADGVSFEDLYKTEDNNEQANPENLGVYDNMETATSEVTPIVEEISSDPLFTANVAPLSIEHDENKAPEDPWAEDENNFENSNVEDNLQQPLDVSLETPVDDAMVNQTIDESNEESMVDNFESLPEQIEQPLDEMTYNPVDDALINQNELSSSEEVNNSDFELSTDSSQQLVQEDVASSNEQPMADWQFEQIFPEDPVIINKDSIESVTAENLDSNANEDVWKF